MGAFFTLPRKPLSPEHRAENRRGAAHAAIANAMLETVRAEIRLKYPELEEDEQGGFYAVTIAPAQSSDPS